MFVIIATVKLIITFLFFSGASNIVFSNGLLDPWSGGGVFSTENENIQIVIIPDGAHHLDLRSTNPEDPASITYARQLYVKYIQRWIRNHADISNNV